MPQVVARCPGIGDELLAIEDLQYRKPCDSGDGIPPESREGPEFRLKCLNQLSVGDDHPHGIAIPNRFAEGHDIRRQPPTLEAPKVRPGTAPSIFPLVADDQTAGGAQPRRYGGEPDRRWIMDAAARQGAVDKERGGSK